MSSLTKEMIIACSKQSDLESIKELNCLNSDLNDVSIVRKLRHVEVLSLGANRISTLADFKYCHDLRELHLTRNNIQDINDLTYLRGLKNLKSLWLEENPCVASCGYNYRLIVLRTLPSLKKLDNVDVTADELTKALQMEKIEINRNQKAEAVSSNKANEKTFTELEVSNVFVNVLTSYESEMHNGSKYTATGSKLQKDEVNKSQETNSYNPFEHRNVSHPTTDAETLIHLIKGSLGSGILSMPLAYSNAGLWFGLFGTFAIGAICTYCVHILVKCAHILSKRAKVPSLDYADVAETAFLIGHKSLHKWSRLARFLINFFLVLYLIGCCCTYSILVAESIQQIVEFYHPTLRINIRLYILMLLPILICSNLIRKLKFLVWFSLIANTLMAVGLGITLYYIVDKLPSVTSVQSVASVSRWPMFFGTVIFAIEGMGVVMSLENHMKNPTHFIGCPGVLNIGMTFLVTLYAAFGFLGFLKYGGGTKGSITLNLPPEDALAQAVKLMIAIAIFLTYSLQFFVPMDIIWRHVKGKFVKLENVMEYVVRIALVTLTVIVSIIVPNLGPFISLIGAICLSTLGLMFPAIIETITYWDSPGMGRFKWRLIKNSLLVIFGIIGFVSGSFVSIDEIISNT